MEQSTVTVNTVDWLSVGHIEISLTDWTDGLEPEITAGSVLEIGGSIFYASGDDDLDIAGAWGGIANDTLVYIYYSVSGTTATAELSTTAPTWDDEKQGWYDAGKTKRCVGSIYKDSGGNYDKKTIFLGRTLGEKNLDIVNPQQVGNYGFVGSCVTGAIYRDTTPTETYTNIKRKIIEIGNWDMDATASVTVNHNLTVTTILAIKAIIRNDADTARYPIDSYSSGFYI